MPGRRGQFVKSGTMYFYAEGTIKSKAWLRLELNIGLSMDPTIRNTPVAMELSVAFYGKDLNLNPEPKYASKILSIFPTEVAAQKHFSQLIKQAHDVALKSDAKRLHLTALKNFVVPS